MLVAGAAGGDDDFPHAPGLCILTQNAYAAVGIVGNGQLLLHIGRFLFIHPGDQHIFLTVVPEACQDAGNLLCGLSRAVNYLSRTLAELAVQVYLGIAQVLKGLLLQMQQCLVHRDRPLLNTQKQFPDLTVHSGPPNPAAHRCSASSKLQGSSPAAP